LAAHARSVQMLGAVALALVAARGVVGLVRAGSPPSPDAADDAAPPACAAVAVPTAAPVGVLVGGPVPAPAERCGRPGASTAPAPGRTFLRFVALTAVNPLTVVYFVAVAAGLADRLATPTAAVAFVVGIGVASAAWQLALAAAGTALGARVSPRLRTVLALVGYAVVGGFAVELALP
ncbi:MAG: LysE family transporter, partial [Actinotalea sp.]|nr:LysE family transporter [Actinotalea sp.]